MSSSTTPNPPSESSGSPANVVQVDGEVPRLTFEEQIQLIWAKHRNAILLGCAIVIAAVVGVELVKQYLASRERAIGVEFGAADTSEKLRGFANEHSGHQLAGIAWLKLADEAYAAAKYSEAATNYEKALAGIALLPFAGRARLGLAMSQIAAGDKAKGEAGLKALSDDTKELKALRAEARYNLALLAKDAGKLDEVRKLCGEISGLDDMGSIWSQRALYLQMTLGPVPTTAAKP